MDDYIWETEDEHANNSVTMGDFLENHLEQIDIEAELEMVDGSYAECVIHGQLYEVHASGNGDFRNHKVEFKLIEDNQQ